MKFENAYLVWFIIVLPIYWLGLIYSGRMQKKKLNGWLAIEMQARLIQRKSSSRASLKRIAISLALMGVVVALLRPQEGIGLEIIEQKSRDICIAIDTSKSMLASDLAPNRLQVAKREIQKFISALKGDRVSLIAFAGGAVLQCPLTNDLSAANIFLDVMDTDLVPIPGTAIGSAIELAQKKVFSQNQQNKILLILTDGETHDKNTLTAAKTAAQMGMRIYTIGIGSTKGAPIPKESEGKGEYRKNDQGEIVISKLDASILEQIATETGGRYFHVEPERDTLQSALREIEKIEAESVDKSTKAVYLEQFQYFLLLSILLLSVDSVLSLQKARK